MKELRLGVIGCTSRGTLADNAHKPEDGVRIVAGADIYPDARELFLKRYEEKFQFRPNVYEDYKEMIEKENLDGVFITAPDFLHEEMGIFALEHKVPVYMEKPLALSIAGADRILEAAYRNRTKLVVGHNMRYMDFTRKMKQLIDAGEIGEVKTIWCRHFICYGGDAYFKDWHAVERYANTMLLQKGAHDIDIIHWLANGYSSRVHGMGNLTVYDKLPRRDVSQKRIPYTKVAEWLFLDGRKANDAAYFVTQKTDDVTKEKYDVYTAYMVTGTPMYIVHEDVVNGGFATFKKEEDAKKALESLNGLTGIVLRNDFEALKDAQSIVYDSSLDEGQTDAYHIYLTDWMFSADRKANDCQIVSAGDKFSVCVYFGTMDSADRTAKDGIINDRVKAEVDKLAAAVDENGKPIYQINERIIEKMNAFEETGTETVTLAA